MARSSRMCGRAGASRPDASSFRRGGRKRGKCTASGWTPAFEGRRVRGQIAREHRRLGLAVEDLAPQPLARQRHADDAGQALPARPRLRLARGSERGQRHHLDLGAGKLGARDGLVGEQAQDRLQPVVAGVVQVVGLGGREQQAIDAAGQDARQPRMRAGLEALEHGFERALQVVDGVGRRS